MGQQTVHLLVFDSMADWEAAFAIAGINNPRFQRRPGRYRVLTVGAGGSPITTIGGVRILPDTTIAEIDPDSSAMLILPGGETWESGANPEAINLARTFFVHGAPLAAICGATLALARGGILDDFHHTSNSREYLSATGYRGGSFYCDLPAVSDENLITASGTAPIEFAREIFRTLDLYTPDALDAWYSLFKFSNAAAFELMQ